MNTQSNDISNLVEFYKNSAGIKDNNIKAFEHIPNLAQYEANILSIYGSKAGKKWLDYLPKLVEKITEKYNLSDLIEVQNLTYNYILSGTQGTISIILKIGLDIQAIEQEAFTLNAFREYGGVRLLAAESGILLLEKAIPGNSLQSYFPDKDEESIQIISNLIKQLHKAPIFEHNRFPNLKDWLISLDQDWDIPESYLQKARILRDQLVMSSSKSVLLHGDLHHDNILQNGNDWLVIDAKGVIGDPAYELAVFIYNPIPDLLNTQNPASIISNRINKFAKLMDLSPKRIHNWCFVQAILAWSWTIEDNCDQTYFRKLAEILHNIAI